MLMIQKKKNYLLIYEKLNFSDKLLMMFINTYNIFFSSDILKSKRKLTKINK